MAQESCASDNYACQWDQSIASSLGIARWAVTDYYNGKQKENGTYKGLKVGNYVERPGEIGSDYAYEFSIWDFIKSSVGPNTTEWAERGVEGSYLENQIGFYLGLAKHGAGLIDLLHANLTGSNVFITLHLNSMKGNSLSDKIKIPDSMLAGAMQTDFLMAVLPFIPKFKASRPRVSGGTFKSKEPAAFDMFDEASFGPLNQPEKVVTEKVVTKSAADRASEIHKAVPEATQRRTTIAVTETQEGIRVVSSSEKRLRPAQRKLLGNNEVEGVGLGHAEVTGVNYARGAGLNPIGTAASRPICSDCQGFLKDQNVKPLSPLKK